MLALVRIADAAAWDSSVSADPLLLRLDTERRMMFTDSEELPHRELLLLGCICKVSAHVLDDGRKIGSPSGTALLVQVIPP